ncbi:pantoate--beta-alanine ligase [Leptospira interrogans]|uniref:pantoate--beta-alanine ligase n=1 Tax=Leptospira interrogans TaxID=173 RepID=UPI000297C8D5|nr:pantoate--beta-alanine ligase [Leptospira interrogans]KAA1267392.1 pantoate--beta-alanine ligase [Leptospira interrogans serovar Weerasinghe]KAA1292015.1 pantoate--beta-alanine ligase [Leptospira interrogans serovar Geyaweera]EKR37090.1 pantoate--beta-alanine ligase [Leptospira interrogans serovar Hebdomadis str. R499]MCR8648634.1 pantoate--beta-alanine ligase [Leptospira interrogans serovar Bataviae]OAM85709.1 pantoate--beta-alanine ligase [Leptospira interrogans serovar Bataviae]
MIVCKTPEEVLDQVRLWKAQGKRIGFVPTMGFLHEGHASLFEECISKADKTVVSIFVNPAQFNDPEDYAKYPVNTEGDLKLCESKKVDLVFLPDKETIYPDGIPDIVLKIPNLMKSLCAVSRPGHFEGVLLVISRLFHFVQPDFAFFGKKDYQQYLLIREFCNTLAFPIEVIGCETVRSSQGLALSSRNSRLSETEKEESLLIYRSLKLGENQIFSGIKNPLLVKEIMKDVLDSSSKIRLDYLEILNADTLDPLEVLEGEILLAIAAFIGPVRLIDNLTLSVPTS